MSQDNQPQWNPSPDNSSWQQPLQPQQPQYDQSQWQQQQYGQPQWQQPNQYNQYNQPQYGANQYNVPSYAQVQPQADNNGNFFMRWIMMRLAMRVAFLVIGLMLCGGCALFVFLATMAQH
ncbi:MAG: hypothetical protein ACR2H5_19635 [Ktedonobacteraceae bacterium]